MRKQSITSFTSVAVHLLRQAAFPAFTCLKESDTGVCITEVGLGGVRVTPDLILGFLFPTASLLA